MHDTMCAPTIAYSRELTLILPDTSSPTCEVRRHRGVENPSMGIGAPCGLGKGHEGKDGADWAFGEWGKEMVDGTKPHKFLRTLAGVSAPKNLIEDERRTKELKTTTVSSSKLLDGSKDIDVAHRPAGRRKSSDLQQLSINGSSDPKVHVNSSSRASDSEDCKTRKAGRCERVLFDVARHRATP